MAINPIQILINAKDEASAVFDRLQLKVTAVMSAILGFLGIRAFVGVVEGAATFEQALSRVQAATGASAAEMVELKKAAEDAAAAGMGFTSVQAAGALENLAKAGLSAGDAIKTLPAVMNLAAAGDIELGTSAEYITKAINGLGLAFTDAGRVADVLAKGANATNTSVSGLAQALSYAAPLANTLGLSLEQTVAIIGKFADAGIDASRAGTALNGIMAQFSDPASKFRTELAAAGITTTNFDKALHALAKGGPAVERAINAVGTEAGPALRALLNQGIGKLDDLTASLKDSEGSAAATAKVMQDNLKGAFRTLGSAWESLTNALATPVLPVLTQGIKDLSVTLKAAVSDGTAKKLGDAIGAGFQSAIVWVKGFVASFDAPALITRIQEFAGQLQANFERIGQYATNAGNVLKVVWGVMATGTNTVLAAIYGVGAAMTSFVATVQGGVALILTAWSKITFGGVSEGFRQAADAVLQSSQATAAASEELGRRSKAAIDDATASANLFQEGVAGISAEMDKGAAAAGVQSAGLSSVAAQLQVTAEANAKAAEQSRQATAAQAEQTQKTQDARAAHAELQAQYAQAIATSDVQRAGELMQQLRRSTDEAGLSAKDLARREKEAADEIVAAFARVGIQTKESLGVAASTARSDFEKIKASGQATAEGLQAAWKKAAEAAIAANNGVAPAWVQGEASANKYQVAIDEAGRATLKLSGTDLSGIASGLIGAANAAGQYAKALANAGAATAGVIDSAQQIKSTQKSGETRGAGTDLGSRTGIAAFLKAAGVDDDKVAREIASEFADEQGNVQYFNNRGQKKYGGNGSTLSQALLKAAESYTFGDRGRAAQEPSTIPKPESGRTVRVDLNLNGQSYGALNTDPAGADLVQRLFEQLAAAKGTAA